VNRKKLYSVYLSGLLLSCFAPNVFSQTIKAQADRDRIFIGEQIKLTLSVEGGKAGMSWFKFPDSVNHLEIVGRSKIDTVLKGSYTNYYQTIAITSFDSGRWEFPSLSLAGFGRSTTPITIDVLPVDVSKMEDYNDIKDIEEVQRETNWLIVGIIAAITLLAIGMVYWLIIKKKKVVVPDTVLKGNQSPLEWALSEINKLNAQNLQQNDSKKYYSELTGIGRTFFHLQLQEQFQQKTTDEWMINLQSLPVDNDTKTAFFQFLRLADTVKFAKYLPPEAEKEVSVDAIKQMLQKVSLLHSNIYSKYQPQ
jgi:hypothetical protein